MKQHTRAIALSSSMAFAGLLLAACGGSSSGASSPASSGAASAAASTAASTATSSTPTASVSEASPTPTPTPTPTMSKAGTLVVVKSYTYVPVPSDLSPIVSALKKTGLIDTVKARGLVKGNGDASNPDLAIVISTYKPTLATQLDALPVKTVLDNAVKGAAVSSATTGKSTDYVASGTHVRVINGKQLTMAVIYQKGGVLIQIYGAPKSSQTLKFAQAYLAAGG